MGNSSVLTRSYSDSSAATSNATNENGTVLERPSGNEEQSSIDEQRTMNKPISGAICR